MLRSRTIFTLLCLSLTACKPSAPEPVAPMAVLPDMVLPTCINNQCAVLNQKGEMLVKSENPYDVVISQPFAKNFIFARNGSWNLVSGDGKQFIKPDFTRNLSLLTPGLFSFVQDGKLGILNEHGDEVQPPALDRIYFDDEATHIVYEIGDKAGLLDTSGRTVTGLIFDVKASDHLAEYRGEWVIGKRNGADWAFNLTSREQREVGFDHILHHNNEVLVVEQGDKKGLASKKGELLTSMSYDWIGVPGRGLVAFRSSQDQHCGYLDFKGRIAIPPAFEECGVFGLKSAWATIKDAASGRRKTGFTGRDGKWLIQPIYDWAGPAGPGLFPVIEAPGYAQTAVFNNRQGSSAGLFDLDNVQTVFKTNYRQVQVLTPDLFVFSKENSPDKSVSRKVKGGVLPTVGVMDVKGQVVIPPGEYSYISLDKSGRFLRAESDIFRQTTVALFDLQGRLLVPAEWQDIVVDDARKAIFVYEVSGPYEDEVRRLRALHTLAGTPVFETRKLECGAHQLFDHAGKTLWPVDPTPYCPKPPPNPALNQKTSPATNPPEAPSS